MTHPSHSPQTGVPSPLVRGPRCGPSTYWARAAAFPPLADRHPCSCNYLDLRIPWAGGKDRTQRTHPATTTHWVAWDFAHRLGRLRITICYTILPPHRRLLFKRCPTICTALPYHRRAASPSYAHCACRHAAIPTSRFLPVLYCFFSLTDLLRTFSTHVPYFRCYAHRTRLLCAWFFAHLSSGRRITRGRFAAMPRFATAVPVAPRLDGSANSLLYLSFTLRVIPPASPLLPAVAQHASRSLPPPFARSAFSRCCRAWFVLPLATKLRTHYPVPASHVAHARTRAALPRSCLARCAALPLLVWATHRAGLPTLPSTCHLAYRLSHRVCRRRVTAVRVISGGLLPLSWRHVWSSSYVWRTSVPSSHLNHLFVSRTWF